MFISFEGPEGAGKTTQIQRLHAALTAREVPVTVTREPGGTPLGTRVREILLDPALEMDGMTELLLFNASRRALVTNVIRPRLLAGETVLIDRYADSSRAYQCFGRGLNRRDVDAIIAHATGGLEPHLTLLLDLPPATGLARAAARGQPDRLEQADLTFHENVRLGFRALAGLEPHRFVQIDADRPADDVAADVLRAYLDRRHLLGD